jgi:hypothetical protein
VERRDSSRVKRAFAMGVMCDIVSCFVVMRQLAEAMIEPLI